MARRPTTTVTTASDGRLPTPAVDWPISEESFARLTKQWRLSNVWLSLWNHEGENVTFDSQGTCLWTMFWSHGEHFRRQLGVFARAAVTANASEEPQASARAEPTASQRPEQSNDQQPTNQSLTQAHQGSRDACDPGAALGPWWPELGLIAVPVRRRRRVVGVVLGGIVLKDRLGEGFSRLCTRCGVDRRAMADFASQAGMIHEDEVKRVVPLLAWAVEQAHEIEMQREETTVLTSNLENTYEELNLIYQISSQMHLPQKPSRLCERVGREVLEVSRASAVAFVLNESDLPNNPTGPAIRYSNQPLSDRVVQIGHGAPSLHDLDRLAESLNIDASSVPGHILINQIHNVRELEWAKGWLEHLVALPLWHEQQLLGVLLAINCDDEGDFSSVDVQLFRAVADRVAAFLENQRLYDGVTDLLMGLLRALVNSIDAKDRYTCGHSERVAFISRALAQKANLSPVECERVYLAGLIHDIGKLGVADAILCKPGRLTTEEFDAMKKHPEIGLRILSGVRQIADLMPGVAHHHERMDGRGYPHGLAGKAIPLLSRIICLGDCFDAMTTSRTYRAALPLPMALAEIRRCSGTQFDPELAELFLRLDHKRLLEEAQGYSNVDLTIGQTGALNTAMSESPVSCEPQVAKPASQASLIAR